MVGGNRPSNRRNMGKINGANMATRGLTRLARLSRIALARVSANAATAIFAYGTESAGTFGGAV